MTILILTIGTRGDVQPFVALGVGLKENGHNVTICAPASFEGLITEHGLDYAYMNDEIVRLSGTDAGHEVLEGASGLTGRIRAGLELWRQVKPAQRQMLEEEWTAAQQVKPDLVIYHPKAMGGYHIAERLGVPAIIVATVPIYLPTSSFPNMLFPHLPLGGWYNRLTYRLIPLMMASYAGLVNEWRKEALGLPARPRMSNELVGPNGAPTPVLHCYSAHLAPPPEDWPPTAVVTGFWTLEDTGEWAPPAELVEFLEAGPPPVYVGFGSMAGRDPGRVTRTVVESLSKSGQRGVIATGWGGLDGSELPAEFFRIEAAPHDWLFPRVAAVVHHGGAGTTGAGLRAGRPTVICPFFGDQPFWGQRVCELGAGPKPIPQKKLTADNLADAIDEAAMNPRMRERAASLGEAIRAEDGVANAVGFIEAYMEAR